MVLCRSFLQALKSADGMDRLTPMLAEMGLSGTGVTQTLSTLAGKLADTLNTSLSF